MVAKPDPIANERAVTERTEKLLARMQLAVDQLKKSLDETAALLAKMKETPGEPKPQSRN
jgi:hypothetical protein